MIENIEKSHCEHLDNYTGDLRNCSCKRYLTVSNPKTGRIEVLVFCNEWFRLNVQQKVNEKSYHETHQYVAIDLLEKMILKHFDLRKHIPWGRYANINNISIDLCKRPYVYTYVNIRTAIDWYNLHESRDLFLEIKDAILHWCGRNERFKKHKSNCARIKTILNKIHYEYDEHEKEMLFNELFLIILKLTTNEAD